MREVVSRKNRIRMSPWKINLLTRQVRGLPVVEALMQLKFSRKQKGPPLVAKVIQNAANLANIRHNLQAEDLMVAEAFVNRANIQKGIMFMGKGRFGLKLRRYSHVVVRLKEIDFEGSLAACKNRFQRARWETRRALADKVREEAGHARRRGRLEEEVGKIDTEDVFFYTGFVRRALLSLTSSLNPPWQLTLRVESRRSERAVYSPEDIGIDFADLPSPPRQQHAREGEMHAQMRLLYLSVAPPVPGETSKEESIGGNGRGAVVKEDRGA
jgi:large subunit ribosomal protein L22